MVEATIPATTASEYIETSEYRSINERDLKLGAYTESCTPLLSNPDAQKNAFEISL